MKTATRRMWTPVFLIGSATTAGLVLALLGDGPWDWISAILLGVPVAVSIRFGARRPRRPARAFAPPRRDRPRR